MVLLHTTSTSEHNSLELNRFCEPKPSEKVIPKCVVSTRTGPKGQKGITSTSEQDSLENCLLYLKLYCTENYVIIREVLRLTDQHRTRIAVKRAVHWNRIEPNLLRTEPARTVLQFLHV